MAIYAGTVKTTFPNLWLSLVVASIAGTFITPHPLGGWLFVLQLAEFSWMTGGLTEPLGPGWSGSVLTGLWGKYFWTLWGITAASLALRYRLVGRSQGMLALSAVVICPLSPHLAPFLIVLCAPWYRDRLRDFAHHRQRSPYAQGYLPAQLASCAFSVGLIGLVVSGALYRWSGDRVRVTEELEGEVLPRGILPSLNRISEGGRMFLHPSLGSWFRFRYPRVEVFGDTRMVSMATASPYLSSMVNPRLFKEIDDQFLFDGVIVDLQNGLPLADYLLRHEGWKLVGTDYEFAFFVRRDSGWSPRFESLDILPSRSIDVTRPETRLQLRMLQEFFGRLPVGDVQHRLSEGLKVILAAAPENENELGLPPGAPMGRNGV